MAKQMQQYRFVSRPGKPGHRHPVLVFDRQDRLHLPLTVLAALFEQEILKREQSGIQFRIQQAHLPLPKTLDTFDFTAIPSLNKAKVVALTHGEWIDRHENAILVGNSGTGKTHLAISLGYIACQADKRVRFNCYFSSAANATSAAVY